MKLPDSEFAVLAQMELDWLYKERENGPDPNTWRWSPLELREFEKMLGIAVEHITPAAEHMERPVTFFEAGAGIGTKLYLAEHEFGLFAHGWEINDEYIRVAESLGVSIEANDVSQQDPHWEEWDIVYIARIFKEDEAEIRLERHVLDSMSPGAVFMGAYLSVKPYSWTCRYRAPWRGVWVKPS